MDGLHDKRALVVDDQRTVTTLLSAMLQRLGFLEVDVAHDGKEALAKLGAEHFDLVISDIVMEPMCGLALTRTIRDTAALKDLPIILATAGSDPTHFVAAKRIGANECLIKPFTLAVLRERIARLPRKA